MIELGKYATTVLSAYGVSLVLLGAVVIQTIRANTRARHALQEHEKLG